jgi:protein SCO1/2
MHQSNRSAQGVMTTVVVLLAIAALFVGIFVVQHWRQAQIRDVFEGTYLQQARALPEFELQSTQGPSLSQHSMQGHWTWLFFGFTQCPSLCPTTLAKLAKAYQTLQNEHASNLPHVVMVSLDPERDDLTHLKQYMQGFNLDFYGARGSVSQTQALTNFLGVAYAKVAAASTHDKNNEAHYSIEHSGVVMIMNPQGELQAYVNPPFTAEALVHDHLMLVRK